MTNTHITLLILLFGGAALVAALRYKNGGDDSDSGCIAFVLVIVAGLLVLDGCKGVVVQ